MAPNKCANLVAVASLGVQVVGLASIVVGFLDYRGAEAERAASAKEHAATLKSQAEHQLMLKRVEVGYGICKDITRSMTRVALDRGQNEIMRGEAWGELWGAGRLLASLTGDDESRRRLDSNRQELVTKLGSCQGSSAHACWNAVIESTCRFAQSCAAALNGASKPEGPSDQVHDVCSQGVSKPSR
jgi:hypothetical protein